MALQYFFIYHTSLSLNMAVYFNHILKTIEVSMKVLPKWVKKALKV